MPLIHLLKCLGALLTSWCLLCSGASAADNGRILMVTEATFPPYEFREENAIMGIDPEIMREVARRAGKELVIEDMSFDSVITAVVSGKADVAASGIRCSGTRKKWTFHSLCGSRSYHRSQRFSIRKRKISAQRIECSTGHGDIYVTRNIQQPERFPNGALLWPPWRQASGRRRH
ncbi:MAG: transporter substrate-binding domain-containing protein [Akkermansia sp.]